MWIADLSRGWPTLTGAVLKQLGASGVIGYAGCIDPLKNVSKTRFEDWVNSGLMVALVVENGSEDLKGGASVGAAQGKALSGAARSLGYDTDNCVLFASADWNSRGSDLDAINAAMEAFSNYIAHPSLYGNSYAIDKTVQSGNSLYGWQSESTSFSNGLSQFARLQQIYNDPRAQGRALDVNNVIKQPLLFMGENVSLNGPEHWDANDWNVFWSKRPPNDPSTTVSENFAELLGYWNNSGIKGLNIKLDNILKAIEDIPGVTTGSFTMSGTVTGSGTVS